MPRPTIKSVCGAVLITLICGPIAVATADAASSGGAESPLAATVLAPDPTAPQGPTSTGPEGSAISLVPILNPRPAQLTASDGPSVTHTATRSQVISIPLQGGSMSVSPSTSTVVLHRLGDSNRFSGNFGPVVVTDARGNLDGWVLSTTATGSSFVLDGVSIRPGAAVAVTGHTGDAIAARPGTADAGGGVDLMDAPGGGGGGMFQISGTVTVADGAPGDTATIALHFAVR
jgi:hypothetical protein